MADQLEERISSPKALGRGGTHPINVTKTRTLSNTSSEGGFLSSPEPKPILTPPSHATKPKKKTPTQKNTISSPSAAREETVTRWIVCSAFRKEQERLNIPTDPTLWERLHVAHWANWAKKEFPEASFDPTSSDWDVDGQELCSLSNDEFKKVCRLIF